jgi:hypothetical protein
MTGCPATYQKLPGQQRVAVSLNACMPAWCHSAIEAKTQVDVGAAVKSKVSYAAFKCPTANAVRAHDMKCVLRKHRSTVSRYICTDHRRPRALPTNSHTNCKSTC